MPETVRDRKSHTPCYDNVRPQKIKAATNELPLPKQFNKIWLNLNKVFDGLDLKNHKNNKCHVEFNPKRISDMYQYLAETKNTMAVEQTFVWLESV